MPRIGDGADIATSLIDGAKIPSHIPSAVAHGQALMVVGRVKGTGATVGIKERVHLLLAERRCLLGHETFVVGLHLLEDIIALLQKAPVAVDGAGDDLRMLGWMCDVPGALDGHLLPVETSPALRHHQQVERTAVLFVVLFKEVVGLWHKALDLRS